VFASLSKYRLRASESGRSAAISAYWREWCGIQHARLHLHDDIGRLFEVGLPFGIRREQSAAALPFRKAVVTPQMDDLVEFPYLGMKIPDQISEDPRLNAESAGVVVLIVHLHRAGFDGVSAFFDDHVAS